MPFALTEQSHLMPSRAIASALRTLDIDRAGIDAVREAIDGGELGRQLAAAVGLIRGKAGRLIVTGVGKSGHIGRKFAATLSSTGTPSYFMHPTEASHGDLGMITSEDVLVALSWSGETAELAGVINYIKRFEIPMIGVTSQPESTMARTSAVPLILPKVKEACPHGLAPTTSTLIQLALCDAIAIALLEERGFSALDFKIFHPGGKLGAQLKFVRDLMHAGEMPLLPSGARMSEAVVEMTSRGFGIVGVLGAAGDLVGVVTDGDLRRHMAPDLMSRTVDEIMSRHPTVTAPDAVAGEALAMMQTRKISVAFAVEDRRPVGIVHMLDFLRAGVA